MVPIFLILNTFLTTASPSLTRTSSLIIFLLKSSSTNSSSLYIIYKLYILTLRCFASCTDLGSGFTEKVKISASAIDANSTSLSLT